MLEAKEKGTETVSMEAFIRYLDTLKENYGKVEEYDRLTHEAKLAEFEAENQRQLVDRKAVFESIFAYGQLTIKSALLLNGGAALAILAFIGNLWSKQLPQDRLGPLADAMAAFPFGALAAVIGAGIGSWTQYCYSRPWWKTAYFFHGLGILTVATSLGLFAIGAWNSYKAFSMQLSTPTIATPTASVPAR